jgi:hypothetical protein
MLKHNWSIGADVEVSRDRSLRATRLEFAPEPMLSSVMKYLSRLPAAVPPGQILVHNTVSSSRRLGSRGFRAWLDKPSETVEPCDCGWLAELGPHYRIKRAGDLLLDRRRQRLGQAGRPCGCGVRRARNAIFNLFRVHDAQGPGNSQLSPARSPTGPSTNIVASE